MTQTQTFKLVTHKNRKHSIMFMLKTMLRKTLNGINDSIVDKFVSNKGKRKRKNWYLISNFAGEKKM